MRTRQLLGGVLILAVAVLTGIALWQTAGRREPEYIIVTRRPERVMGTTCALAAMARPGGRARAGAALADAEAILRQLEARMSVWLTESEISRFNTADAGQEVPLSRDSLAVLHAARDAAISTGGAFDVTCRPVIELWRRAGEQGRPPAARELESARASSTWGLIELTGRGAVKRRASAQVDLGGIAKGYAVDRAVARLQDAGLAGGLVDVGGDLRCFGRGPEGKRWMVDVRDPFGVGTLGRLRVRDAGVCTSGNYARFTVVAGTRYSHIIDPRSGSPANAAPSVTVVAPTAVDADVWATALSVLGVGGIPRLPEGVEAMMILGSREARRAACTRGMRGIVSGPISRELGEVK